MKFRISGIAVLAVWTGLSLPAGRAVAQEETLEQRLRELEGAYTELLVRDREKDRELERLRDEVSALRQGRRDAGAHRRDGHDEREHASEHAHGPEHGHDGTAPDSDDVLLEARGVRVYVPSLGFDFVGYRDDSSQDLEARLSGLRGFGHAHGGDGHEHEQLEDGFNLRHAEAGFAAAAVGFGRAQVLINADEDGVELEEAFVQSAPVAGLAAFKAGRFRSEFGFFNQYHTPEWKFADAPLAHFLLFGGHGLEGTGVQATVTPPGLPVRVGLEVFQSGGDALFSRDEAAGDVEEPSVYIGWLKGTVYERGASRLVLGLAGGSGSHQEVHDDASEPETLDGDAWFLSPGFAYIHRGTGPHGAGDIAVRGEYVYRAKDLADVENGEPVEATQDGYFLEAAYGFAPRFEAGLRWEQVGLINETVEGEATEAFGGSWRAGGFFAFHPVRWTRLGVQAQYGSYDFADGRDEVFQALGRAVFRFGPHFH